MPRVFELGGQLPTDIREFADRASCPDAHLPGPDPDEHPRDAAGGRAVRHPHVG